MARKASVSSAERRRLTEGAESDRVAESFLRSCRIVATSLHLANAPAASKSQKPHFTSGKSCRGDRKKARSEPVGEAPPAPSGCLTAVRLSPRYPLYVPKAALLHCAAFGRHAFTLSVKTKNSAFAEFLSQWLPRRDSNPNRQNQNLQCYHYTTRQSCSLSRTGGVDGARTRNPRIDSPVR